MHRSRGNGLSAGDPASLTGRRREREGQDARTQPDSWRTLQCSAVHRRAAPCIARSEPYPVSTMLLLVPAGPGRVWGECAEWVLCVGSGGFFSALLVGCCSRACTHLSQGFLGADGHSPPPAPSAPTSPVGEGGP